MPTLPLLVVACGTTKDAICRVHGDFGAWIRTTGTWPEGAVHEIAVYREEELPPPTLLGKFFSGVVLTGSPAMVSEHLPWMRSTEAWLRDLLRTSFPVLGICFGHQLIASALGGTVGDHPQGMELGTTEIQLHAAAQQDRLFGGLPMSFPVQATHAQSVLTPPDEAQVLAFNDYERFHALRFRPGAWGVQFHPEIDAAIMDGYKECYREEAEQGNKTIGYLGEPTRHTPEAASVLQRFRRICEQA